ncbi:hydroxyacid-oxoacid transhydrogenase [uncultured Cocleimonas sp.]|uniref:hydroxyacid-oxoacid transhydrogenase n=1 Tax=uncultured Cocleimonas sp. TaxID=1051587 RepID=UPI002624A07A|nr:hydroxyacid-oxoacid transhydrogenase [uncultured Cocleimonas sp.]
MACQYFAPCDHGADSFTIAIPKVTFGRGTLAEVGERAQSLKMSNVALFTDAFLKDGPYVETVTNSLKKAGIDYQIFSDIRIEPDDVCVDDAAKFLTAHNFDGMISVGGGSVIDVAKAAMVCAKFPAPVRDYFAPPVGEGKPIPGPLLPHIACPTTAGTGSECTSISVIRIRELNTKFVFASPYMLPDQAVIDPTCCESLTPKAVASTGFDLLSHALECYTARAYTQWDKVKNPNARPLTQGANPWSDLAATQALKIAGEYLVRGVTDASDHEARDQLMWGASLAGMAFGNSGTHLPHALSYGVTHLMHDITTEGYDVKSPFVPHGISVIVTAPATFRYTAEATPERHLEAAAFLQADQKGATTADAGEVVSKRIIELMRGTNIPNGLSGVGFAENDVTRLAESSIRQGRAIANAPRESNLVDLENIYRDAISYW